MKKITQKIVLFIALLFIATSISNAQCYTGEVADELSTYSVVGNCAPTSTCFNDYYKLKNNYIPNVSASVIDPLYVRKTIKIMVHVMNPLTGPASPPENYFDNAGVESLIYEVNKMLGNFTPSWPSGACPTCYVPDSRFKVELVKNSAGLPDIRFYNSGIIFNDIYTASGTTHYSGRLDSYLDKTESVLNVFLVNHEGGGEPAFATMVPNSSHLNSGYNAGQGFIVLSNSFKLPGSDRERGASKFIHEMGHIMGLAHVFDNSGYWPLETCDETDVDYLTDLYSTGSTKVCNTVFMTTNNIMDYTLWNFHLSPMQIGRWHRNAHFLSCRRYVYNTNPEDKNHDHTGEGQIHPLNISRDEVWDFDIKMYSDIVVKSGKKLTVKCRIYMPYHSNIVVEPGGILEIDNGLISSHDDTSMWYGISVLGKTSEWQESPVVHQGKIIMKNGAEIKNALHAINLYDAINYDFSKHGGIAQIEDAIFTNNRRSIAWDSYHNKTWEYKGGVWTKTKLTSNRSYVVRSKFNVNEHMIRKPSYQITMFDVDNIAIRGCEFNYTLPYGTFVDDDKNCAIQNVGSSLVVDKFTYPVTGASTASTFKGFATAVRNDHFATATTFRVHNTTFEDNQIAISAKGNNAFTISNNVFKINNPINSYGTSVGAYLEASTGYLVQSNNFQRSLLRNYSNGQVGTMVYEGGAYNLRVNNNTYEHLNTGNFSDRQNTNGIRTSIDNDSRGLEFRCNNSVGDISFAAQYIKGIDATKHGIRMVQGEASNPAGNLFGDYSDIIQAYSSSSPALPKTVGINAYYHSTLVPAEMPDVYSPNVSPVGVIPPSQCTLPTIYDPYTDGGSTTITIPLGSSAAAAARTLLMDAYEDYTENRNDHITQALLAQHSPYAQTELAIHQMQQGQISQGLVTYYAITDSMQLTAQEHNEFVIGGALMRIIAARFASSMPRWDSLSSTEADSLRYVRNNTVAWAHTRACNWLAFAADEPCGSNLPSIVELNPNNGGNMRRSNNDLLTPATTEYFSINPNPSIDYFELKYNLTSDVQIRISDAVGRILLTKSLPAAQNKYSIVTTEWATGVYLYEVISSGKTLYHGKLIKQ